MSPVDGPTVVCVLGPPRSGTSLTARILNLIGVDLGPEQDLTRPGKARPLWELRQIVKLNERILRKLGGQGLAPPVPEPGWEGSEDFAAEREEARQLLEGTFSGSALWGWKDPRTCLTLPFWQLLVPDMRYVICLRNPSDSVASILHRVDFPRRHAVRTWAVYAASALANTAGCPRAFVSYERYFPDPGPQVDRLARFAACDPPATDMPASRAIEDLVSEGLWNHRTSPAESLDETDFATAVTPLYLTLELLSAADGGVEPGRPGDEWLAQLTRAAELYAERLLDELRPMP